MGIEMLEDKLTVEDIGLACEVREELRKELPHIHFTDKFIMPSDQIGAIKGFSGNTDWDFYKCLEVYYLHKIAVLGVNVPEEEKTISTLYGLGYFIPQRRMILYGQKIGDIYAGYGGGIETINPKEILWDSLRTGRGTSIIKAKLEKLLRPILSQLRGVTGVHFSVYNPCIVTSTDDISPPYVEYDEVFKLPTTTNGLVDFDALVEKIRTMSIDRALAISSLCFTSEGVRHLPMIDFSTSWNDETFDPNVFPMLDRLKIPRKFLVDSGASFHHYSPTKLLTGRQFYDYLKMLSEQPEVGENWPWFSIHQDFSLLRISPSARKLHFPVIVEEKD